MKYRAKATHCIHLIENIYDLNTLEVWHGAHGIYVEVDTQREADIISKLEKLSEETQKYYTMLADERRIEPNL